MSRDALWRALIVIVMVLALEAVCQTGIVPRTVMLAPSGMFASMWTILRTGEFNESITLTLSSVAIAVAIAIVIGAALGAIIHLFPRLRRALDPLFSSYYAVPSFLFYPIFILFFGVGRASIIALAVMMGTVVMIIATLSGLDNVPRVLVRTAQVYRMSRLKTALLVLIPGAAPYVFSGVKLAVAYGFIGVLASEFIMSGSGLGYSIANAYNQFDNRTMYGLLLFVILVVTLINAILHTWDQRLQSRRRR